MLTPAQKPLGFARITFIQVSPPYIDEAMIPKYCSRVTNKKAATGKPITAK
jgi:hypothetical protein